jgi:hypothetical protein
MGTLENGIYQDKTGVQFTLPPDWVIVSHGSASHGAHTVLLRDSITNIIATVWLKPRTGRLDDKVMQRNNFGGYKCRPDSVRNTTIGGGGPGPQRFDPVIQSAVAP